VSAAPSNPAASAASAASSASEVAAAHAAHTRDAVLRRVFTIGVVLGVVGAIAFSGKAIFVKLAYRHHVDTETFLALRMLMSVPFFIAAALWTETRPGRIRLTRGDWMRLVWIGLCGYYLSSYIDMLGLQYVSVSLERLILYLSPTIVLLFQVFVQKHRTTGRQVLALAISYAGVVITLLHDFRIGGPNILLGSGLVFLSAVTYSAYLIGGGELLKRLGTMRVTAWASIVASVGCIAQFLIMRPLSALDLPIEVWGLSVGLALFSTVFPIFFVMMSVARIGASLAAQVGLVGPVSTMILGAIFLGEPLGFEQVAGTVLVMTGVYFVSRGKPAPAATSTPSAKPATSASHSASPSTARENP